MLTGLLFFIVSVYIPSSAFGIEPVTKETLEQQKLNYELQERCGRRAEQLFKEKLAKNQQFKIFLFRNHYNTRLNKCFMLAIFAPNLGDPISKIIYDVNENRIVGSCGEGAKDREMDCNFRTWKDILKETMEEE